MILLLVQTTEPAFRLLAILTEHPRARQGLMAELTNAQSTCDLIIKWLRMLSVASRTTQTHTCVSGDPRPSMQGWAASLLANCAFEERFKRFFRPTTTANTHTVPIYAYLLALLSVKPTIVAALTNDKQQPTTTTALSSELERELKDPLLPPLTAKERQAVIESQGKALAALGNLLAGMLCCRSVLKLFSTFQMVQFALILSRRLCTCPFSCTCSHASSVD